MTHWSVGFRSVNTLFPKGVNNDVRNSRVVVSVSCLDFGWSIAFKIRWFSNNHTIQKEPLRSPHDFTPWANQVWHYSDRTKRIEGGKRHFLTTKERARIHSSGLRAIEKTCFSGLLSKPISNWWTLFFHRIVSNKVFFSMILVNLFEGDLYSMSKGQKIVGAILQN